MGNNKYKILVLSDLKEGTNSTIKNAVNLSKIINADIEFFHVKKPTDIVERESQLSAMRIINKEHLIIEKRIKSIIEPISKSYDINIKSSFAFGNVKSQINDCIESSNPDIVVLGKRKSKSIKFIGDNITDHVLSIYKGEVMIASNDNGLEPEGQLTLGFFNAKNKFFNLKFIDELLRQTSKPLRSFNIGDMSNEKEEHNTDYKVIDYVFEKNDNVFNTLSNYLVKNDVNLLCLNRGKKDRNSIIVKSEIKDVVNKTNVSIFLTNEV